jgi:hypothetical protein
MARQYDTLGRRILRLLETGPRKITVMHFMAPEARLKRTLKRLVDAGLLVVHQKPRLGGAHYALAKQKS